MDRLATRGAVLIAPSAAVIGVQAVLLWLDIKWIAFGASGLHCMGRWTGRTCVSTWGPYSPLVYAPEVALVAAALLAAVGRDRWFRTAALLLLVALAVMGIAFLVTGGWIIGQAPIAP